MRLSLRSEKMEFLNIMLKKLRKRLQILPPKGKDLLKSCVPNVMAFFAGAFSTGIRKSVLRIVSMSLKRSVFML